MSQVQNPSWTDSTSALVELFGGASDNYSMMLSNRPRSVELATPESNSDGSAVFFTTVQMTGDTPSKLPPAAIYRIACFYIRGHLEEEALSQACQSLYDIHQWQIDRTEASVNRQPQVRKLKMNPHLRILERKPFVMSED